MSTRDDSRLRTDSSVYLLSLGDNAVNLGASRAFLMVCVQLTANSQEVNQLSSLLFI